ncbi:MAG: OmpA family protein [Actinomycetota bacterium]
MRRISSLLMSLALLASGVALTASLASAAPGDLTTTTGTAVAPAAIAAATPTKIVRLASENAFLAVGRDVSTSGSQFHLWKIKGDLTIDSTFGAVDLGNDFAYPTPAESVSQYSNHLIGALIVNERLGKYAISFSRSVKGTASSDATVLSIAVGSLSTGAVEAKSVFLSFGQGGSATAADYSAYSTNQFFDDQCTAGTGATVNGAPLSFATASGSTLQFRPDGSLFIALNCDYSNFAQLSPSAAGTLTTATSQLYVGLKKSGSTLVLDTSFGTSGRTVIADGASTCPKYLSSIQTVDSGITSATSTQPYFVHVLSESARSTTLPATYQMMNLSFLTGFDGCSNSFTIGDTYTNSLIPITASGTLLTAQSLGTGAMPLISRWVIDSSGRWNTLLRVSSGMGMNMTTTYTALRLANGVLDTSLGASGQKTLSNLPSSISVGGTSVGMSYSISGVANTATDSYFVGFASATAGGGGSCSSSTTVTQSSYTYQLSFDTGLITSYGTNGLSAPGTFSRVEKGFCPGGGNAASSYVDSNGRPGYVVNLAALGSQAAGLVQFRWDAATGVTGGGDGASAVNTAPTSTTTVAPTTTTVAPTSTTLAPTSPTTIAPTTTTTPRSTTTTVAPTTTTVATTVAPKTTTTTVAPATQNRIDTVVYAKKLPVVVQTNTALQVLSASDAKNLDIRTTTPKVCVALTTSVLLVNSGSCSVKIVDQDTKAVVRSMITTAKASDVRVGSVPTVGNPVMFTQASAVLNAAGLAQVQKIAKAAKNASRVVVIGHAASLTNISQFRFAISRERAAAVKAALVKAGVTAAIEIVAQSDNQPVKTEKTETAQAKNRRADVYIFG